MARFALSGRATSAGTSALPLVSIYSATTCRPRIYEWGLFNTTDTEVVVALNRLSTLGTQGTGLTEVPTDVPEATSLATCFAAHSGGPTVGGEVRRAVIGAAKGQGVIWTWERGLVIDASSSSLGLGALVPVGTGQILDYYIEWEE